MPQKYFERLSLSQREAVSRIEKGLHIEMKDLRMASANAASRRAGVAVAGYVVGVGSLTAGSMLRRRPGARPIIGGPVPPGPVAEALPEE